MVRARALAFGLATARARPPLPSPTAMEQQPDPDHVLFTTLREAFPHIGRGEIREAIKQHGHNQNALWEHITSLVRPHNACGFED